MDLGREHIEDAHAMADGEKAIDEMGTDEARAAGNKKSHSGASVLRPRVEAKNDWTAATTRATS